MNIYITKEDNNYQHLETIKNNRNKRHRCNEFFVEGVRNINNAIRNNWNIKSLVYNKTNKLSSWATEIIKNKNIENHYVLHPKLMDKLSGKTDASELIAVLEMKDNNFDRIKLSPKPLIAIFDRPSNKGNLGTLIRSCDALSCDGLIITGHSVDIYDPNTIVSSMGSFFKLPTIRIDVFNDLYNIILNLKEQYPNAQVVGTSASGEKDINSCNFNLPTILLIGNETNGLSKRYKEISDTLIKIPMTGSASSLNVSCATSIVLYEIYRQRNCL